MARLARQASLNPDFRQHVLPYILNGAYSLERFLRSVYRYRDEREEIVRTPEFMLNDYQELGYVEGDCDDISTLAAAALLVAGEGVRFKAIIYTPNKSEFEHVYVEIWNGSEWIPFDMTTASGAIPYFIQEMIQEI